MTPCPAPPPMPYPMPVIPDDKTDIEEWYLGEHYWQWMALHCQLNIDGLN